MKKKITALALVICLLAVAVVGGTMAYFTDTDKATNTFTFGDVEIDLYEIGPDDKVIDLGDDDKDKEDGIKYENLLPGNSVTKKVYVKNTGSTGAYVRLKLTIENGFNWLPPAYGNGWGEVEANFMDMIGGTLGGDWLVTYADDVISGPGMDVNIGSPAYVTLTYTKELAPETDTTAAFEKIVLPSSLTEDTVTTFIAGDGEFIIKIVAEAIQADGFAGYAEAFEKIDNP